MVIYVPFMNWAKCWSMRWNKKTIWIFWWKISRSGKILWNKIWPSLKKPATNSSKLKWEKPSALANKKEARPMIQPNQSVTTIAKTQEEEHCKPLMRYWTPSDSPKSGTAQIYQSPLDKPSQPKEVLSVDLTQSDIYSPNESAKHTQPPWSSFT